MIALRHHNIMFALFGRAMKNINERMFLRSPGSRSRSRTLKRKYNARHRTATRTSAKFHAYRAHLLVMRSIIEITGLYGT